MLLCVYTRLCNDEFFAKRLFVYAIMEDFQVIYSVCCCCPSSCAGVGRAEDLRVGRNVAAEE